jgi:trans-2,3-dihydro-3-hydroxyanthranilate isomerase
MKYTFHIVDVFSSAPFGGNQLAVLPDASGISTEAMQKIAREFNFGNIQFPACQTQPRKNNMQTASLQSPADRHPV